MKNKLKKILQNKDGNAYSSLFRSKDKETYIELVKDAPKGCKTNTEKLWCILNNITEIPKCLNENCNNLRKFYGVVGKDNRPKQYERPYCSTKCSNSHDTKKKITEDNNFNKYGVKHTFQTDNNKEKSKQTKIEKYSNENYNNPEKKKNTNIEKYGVSVYANCEKLINLRRIPINRLDDYEIYRKIVWKITRAQKLITLSNIERRGLAGTKGAYHLDHKFSMFEGFSKNIPPYIIGNLANLEMLPYADNISKGKKSSIDLVDLINKIKVV